MPRSQGLPRRLDTAKLQPDSMRFRCEIARHSRDVMASQRLRYKVFAREMGARLGRGIIRLDRDRYDKFCRHLLVRDVEANKVVACTRILGEAAARRAGGFYSASEFELGSLLSLPGRVLEVGRTCVHPDYRGGAVIAVLWSRLAEIILQESYDYLIGCASVPIEGNGANVEGIMQRVREQHMAHEHLRVKPKITMRPVSIHEPVSGRVPPLLKAYFNLGARACGEPYRDDDFGVADVFVLLDVADMSPRYARHFLGAGVDRKTGALNVH